MKLDSNGQEHWMDHIGGSGFDEIVSLSMNNDSLVVGGILEMPLTIKETHFGWGNYDMFIAKFAPSGQLSCIQVLVVLVQITKRYSGRLCWRCLHYWMVFE